MRKYWRGYNDGITDVEDRINRCIKDVREKNKAITMLNERVIELLEENRQLKRKLLEYYP